MTLTDLITIFENKLANLGQLKTSAISIGDMNQIVKLEDEEAATLTLLNQLKQIATTA